MTNISARHSIFDGRAVAAALTDRYVIGDVRQCILWASSLNDTYFVEADHCYAWRVYRYGWRTDTDITRELDWLNALHARGVRVATPLLADDGEQIMLIQAPEGLRPAVLFQWAPGRVPAPEHEYAVLYGRAMAELHEASADLDLSGARRIDVESFTTSALRVLLPALAHRPSDADLVAEFASQVGDEITRLAPNLEWGFCHADLHGGNAHVDDETITLFDFDCSGGSWRAYDLAVYAWSTRAMRGGGGEAAEAGWKAFLDGYRSVRALSDGDLMSIRWFVAARHLWYMALHADLLPLIGKQWLSEQAIDGHLKIIQHLRSAYLNSAPRSG